MGFVLGPRVQLFQLKAWCQCSTTVGPGLSLTAKMSKCEKVLELELPNCK